MATQYSGSRSAGDRRRRRIVVNGEGTSLESMMPDGEAGEMESELVASEAAGPWVPVSEIRVWIYSAIIGLGLALLTFAVLRPNLFHKEITPLTNHLFTGYRPVLVVGAQTLFLLLSAQMGLLISWYRARCKLDFGGRHRIWPWAAMLLGLAGFCSATETHQAFASVIGNSDWLTWRPTIVAWLLPFCLAALPITLWVDRDMRNSRSSLYTFRASIAMGLGWAWFEIYHPELKSLTWFSVAYLLLPMFASATLFVSLWHHARVVAYVCPDPPELNERSAWSLFLAAAGILMRCCSVWTWRKGSASDDDGKSKRRRKKTEAEAAPAKRKRRTPARRPAATRTRSKPAEIEEESVEDTNETSDQSDDVEESTVSQEESSWENEQEDWNSTSRGGDTKSRGNGRNLYADEGRQSSVPAPHSRRSQASWSDNSYGSQDADKSSGDSDDESYGDNDEESGSGMSDDQFKGMSKRQKRELKRQMRDQDRNRGR